VIDEKFVVKRKNKNQNLDDGKTKHEEGDKLNNEQMILPL